jgi:V/A-type H+-transporting ATPase subunit A
MTTAKARPGPVSGRGVVTRVSGSLVEVEGLAGVSMGELVRIGAAGLPGEVVGIVEGRATSQAYEATSGLRPGEPVVAAGQPLSVELGPGLLGGIFDGLLRPLTDAPRFLGPGWRPRRARRGRRWDFRPAVGPGDRVASGDLLGVVAETPLLEHRLLVPVGVSGEVRSVAGEGSLAGDARIAEVGAATLGLMTSWPVRRPRPVAARLDADVPLLTGQRAVDSFFPVARGSTAAVPGGFGTGKTVLLQQIAKWCDADVIVYVGCGERGNEMADVLDELPRLEDPRTGRALMERTVVIANTSNMPVMAREASIHTGITVAEHYRDMGYHAVVIADSTSRWAQAMREFSSALGELPAEEGYPAGLASALAAFYERAARVRTLSGAEGSVTIIAAVSPPGGDRTEPVTVHTQRFVRCVWSLDRDLAAARHYPAVSWRESFSRDAETLAGWHVANGDPEWRSRRARAMTILAEADRLEATVQLVGVHALPDRERMGLLGARLLREGVLQQNALSPNDDHAGPAKQAALLDLVLAVHGRCLELVEGGIPASLIEEADLSDVVRVRDVAGPDEVEPIARVATEILERLGALA